MVACSGGSNGGSMLPANPANPTSETSPGAPEASVDQTMPGVAAPAEGGRTGLIPFAAPNPVRRACPEPSHPGEMECYALIRTDLVYDGKAPYGYGAGDLQTAYNAPSSKDGKGQVVAIVDAFGYKDADSDLAAYRKYFHLPPCTTASGCLRILDQNGGHNLPPPNDQGWDYEQALDLDMVSAMCPNCRIVLFQVAAAYTSNLYTGNRTAASLGVDVVSNSWGAGEFEKSDTKYFPAGHTYVASAGDNGGGLKSNGGPQQPCTLSNIVCVGGTALTPAGGARGYKETVWNDEREDDCSGPCGATGSGCSKMVSRPGWQPSMGCSSRNESDISADAAVSTPVAVYHTPGKWLAFGGTSVSAPLVSGMIGLAENGKKTNVGQEIWKNGGKASLNDVLSGTNVYTPITGPCASNVTYICVARKGYDGPTGWGTPNGIGSL